ncbi:SEC12-like protein 2 [Zingiber officinale]|uniref:SEC12-like protein 2 n=1 Tax=Zingiber officinale TaxID=94328 RepID=A0A8J5F2T8_ZINOF|nr:SEC12-like protein 2 [Zingiber officinale]KAG6476708.1 hypothetical protein ZIOFF_065954 [Zingiber officinale]
MARGRQREIPPCSKTYGFPIFCASWVPLDRVSTSAAASAEGDAPAEGEEKEGQGGEGGSASLAQTHDPNRILVALGGGGGDSRSGVPNALLVAEFDFASRSLSETPVCRLGTDMDAPYRMAVHPGGDGVVCSFTKSCRWFEWDIPEKKESNKLNLKTSAKKLVQLEDVGQQLALAFNFDGSILAAGAEDGHLRVFKWPSMENILDQSDAHTTVKDLDFSSNGKFLVSLGSSGPCRVWDLTSSTVTASLARESGENFGFCRFSRIMADNQVLYVTAMNGNQAKIISWDSLSWKRIGTKNVSREPISAFNVSMDGKHLAIGNLDGDVTILRSSDLQAQLTVKKAHLGAVTALAFSQDSRALISASFDSNARVTVIERQKGDGFNTWVLLLVIILAILAYYLRLKEVL